VTLTDKKDDIQNIRNIENKYGLMLFRMGLTHLVDAGHRNFGDDEVEENIKQIMVQGEEDKANGKISIMTPEFQCEILRCAAELSLFSIWTLFAYIKEYVVVGTESGKSKHEAGTCPACGSDELEYDGFFVEDSDCIYKWDCKECGAHGRDYYDMVFSETIVDGEVH
jgi:hypothetical protein